MARRKKPEDQPEDSNDQNAGSDDTFGLPEIEYEPIDRETPPSSDTAGQEPAQESYQSQYTEEQPITNTHMERDDVRQNEYNTTYYEEDEGGSPWLKIVLISLIILAIAAGAYWYFGIKRPQDALAALERERVERAQLDSARRAQQVRDAELARVAEENQRRADSLTAATPAAGTIETLSGRTGRYYVVVASAIDGDLLMDHARRLSEKGVSAKIIPPYGAVKFHRLTVAEGDTFTSTQQTADQLKGEYGDALWVLKY